MTITKPEQALLVAATVRSLAGPARPTEEQFALAKKLVGMKLKHYGVPAASMSGWSWGGVKSAAMKAAPVALPILIPGAVATPFIIEAIKAKKKRDEKAKLLLEKKRVEEQKEAPDAVSPDENAQEVLGDSDLREILKQGGRSEAGAMHRTSSPYYFPANSISVGGVMPNPVYRAAILQRALKISRGRKPEAREMFMAQKTVDRDLGRRGVRITIPGARPGRVTRGPR